MVALLDLWLPILASSVFVFVVSSVIHMATPMHKNDYVKLPGEADILAAMRGQGVAPGNYVFPRPESMKDCTTPEHVEKMALGPVGFMTILPNGPMNMGKSLGSWFGFTILIGLVAGYMATITVPAGADAMLVFRVTGTAALLAYGFANFTDSIWKGVSWGTTGKFFVDGLLYALATGATFAWLWPELA